MVAPAQQFGPVLLASFLLVLLPVSSFQPPLKLRAPANASRTRSATNYFAAPQSRTEAASDIAPSALDIDLDADTAPSASKDVELPFFATWPKWLQNWIRDSGGVKIIVDTATRTLAAPAFYYENPWCFPEFVRISGQEYPWLVSSLRFLGVIKSNKPNVRFAKEAYGDHPRQVAQVMINEGVDETDEAAPLFIFLHGGAWGSGFPTMYRLISLPFLKRNFRAAILGYRTYPEASADGQVDDLCAAVDYFVGKYGGIGGSGGPVVLMGHSSGAHISMLAALRGRLPSIDAFIAASGIYDLESQYENEKRIGVSQISPLCAANGFSPENLRRNSPSSLVASSPLGLPPVLLLHGGADDITLPKNSEDFYQQLLQSSQPSMGRLGIQQGRKERNIKLEVIEGIEHQEIVLDTCLGGKTQSTIMNWLKSTVRV